MDANNKEGSSEKDNEVMDEENNDKALYTIENNEAIDWDWILERGWLRTKK
jgi:hypothetical protein